MDHRPCAAPPGRYRAAIRRQPNDPESSMASIEGKGSAPANFSFRQKSVSVRRKLVLLLSAFAGFAVVAAAVTIYAVHWQLDRALKRFEKATAQTMEIDRLHYALKVQTFQLREISRGNRDAVRPYFAAREEFSSRMGQLTRFGAGSADPPFTEDLRRLAGKLESVSDDCVRLIEGGQAEQAENLIQSQIEGEIIPPLELVLARTKAHLEQDRARATLELGATSTRALLFTGLIGGLAVGLVVGGTALIRRWLIRPIAVLEDAALRFSEGRFDHRLADGGGDEFGRLAEALNQMAGRVAEAHATLHASEMKYRNLFRNLRDAVVICDASGRIVEYHDSDTQLLGFDGGEHVGRGLLDVWPEWKGVTADWALTLDAVVHGGKRFRFSDIALPRAEWDQGGTLFADFLVYRVEFGDERYAAIVARDVTERNRLQTRLRRAETLEAVGSLAGGLAHDFNNLLSAVTGSLTLLSAEVKDAAQAERISAALRACRQAAALSRRLLNFAVGAHGDPQMFRVADMVRMILDSLESSFSEGIRIETDLEDPVAVRMDRDQFTQVALNLLRNGCDAMPDGGVLSIQLSSAVERDPEEGTPPQRYAVLSIRDTGHGMSEEVRRRVFEPLFTTKSRTGGRARGLGMAVVYGAVKNARGFVRVESEPGAGTTIRVFLPAAEDPVGSADSVFPQSPGFSAAGSTDGKRPEPLT